MTALIFLPFSITYRARSLTAGARIDPVAGREGLPTRKINI